MDPTKFRPSTLPLNHTVYDAISRERLAGTNNGKVAVVTGAGRGIGRAIAEALAASGAALALLDLNLSNLAETSAACQALRAKVEVWQCDVTDASRVKTVFEEVLSRFGSVDILVNNAGKSPLRPIHMETFEQFWSTIEVNFKGAMICTFETLPHMRQKRSGCIINIASRAATVDAPFCVGYDAGKAGLVRAVSSIQAELDMDGLGDDIQLYSLHPGGVRTAMGGAKFDADVTEAYPWLLESAKEFETIFKDGPELCGSTCAYIATGRATPLRGLYFDCRQDIERVCGLGRATIEARNLYLLKVEFLQGYENEP